MMAEVTALTKLTNNLYRCTQVYVDKNMEKYKLSIGTYPYLLALKRLPGISQNEVSRELNVDKSMSARTIKKLIELGYIRKEENKKDIRAYKLFITENAEEVIPEIIKILDEWIDILLQGNSEEQKEKGIIFLEGVLENAKKFTKKQCGRRNTD